MRLRRLSVAAALLALSPASAWASGGVWTPVRVAPVIARGSADLPRLALESDGTAVGRLDGERHRARGDARTGQAVRLRQRAIARAPRWRCPTTPSRSARVRSCCCTPSRAPAQRSSPPRWQGASVGPPEQAAATTAPITEAAGGLRADASALAVYAVASSPMTISSAARTPAGGWSPAGDIALPASVTLVQQLQLVLLPDGSAVLLFLGPGRRRRATCRGPTRPCARPPGAWAAHRQRSTRQPSWPAPTSGSQSTRAASSMPSGASPTGACAPRRCPVGGAFSAAQTTATTARTPRVAGASGPTGPTGGGVLLAWLDISGQPVLRTAEWTPAGIAHRRLDPASERGDDAREPRARRPRRPPRRSSPRPRGRALRNAPAPTCSSGRRRATPWTVQNVRTGLTEPVGSPQLAMGSLGALALWVEGNVVVASGTDHALPRIDALAKPLKIGIGVLGPVLGARERHLVADRRRHLAPTATARASTGRPCATPTARAGAFHGTVVVRRRRRQHGAAHVRRHDVADRSPARRRGHGARAEGVDRLPALEPERDRHRDGRRCRERRPCRSAAPCRAAAARSCPGRSSAASASSCASPASTSRASRTSPR